MALIECRALTRTYRPPHAKVGAVLYCRVRRCPVAVVGFSRGPVRWPIGRRVSGEQRGGAGLVVSGDLVTAVRRERVQAVAQSWGICPATVTH